MKKTLFYIILLIVFFGCSEDPKSDKELLEKDKKELLKHLNSYKVSKYKFGKIMIRASAEEENSSPEIQMFKSDIDQIAKKLIKKDNLTLVEYISIYRSYKKMEKLIEKTDEDMFPTLVEALHKTYRDSTSNAIVFFEGNDKIQVQNIEHAILSAIVLLSKDFGKEISLYECSKTNPLLLPDSEIKTLLQFTRGFLFFEKKLFYLSEDEISANINWLKSNQHIDLPYTRAFFKWGNLTNAQTHTAFHSLNHLFRGFDRLMMERAIDEERALEDFKVFLEDSKVLGLENEIVWSIETYLNLKQGNSEKGIQSLNKLKSSNLLSSNDKKTIAIAITYLEKREPETALIGFYDKYFLSKIATKYIFSILSMIDWQQVLADQNVPHTHQLFETMENLKQLIENFEKYSSTETLKDGSKNIWEKARKMAD